MADNSNKQNRADYYKMLRERTASELAEVRAAMKAGLSPQTCKDEKTLDDDSAVDTK